jgi:hypothetical protein
VNEFKKSARPERFRGAMDGQRDEISLP